MPLQTPTHRTTAALARIAEPHGYRFAGDTAHLQARFTVLGQAAHQRAWALQLWACPSAPTSPSELAGQIVAEVALPPMSEITDETEHVETSAFARPPAGDAEHFMALVLTAGRPGQFDEVHDVAMYPRRQQFLQPRMRGTVGYCIEGNRVQLSVEHIENPRDAANCSGTIALELWALAAPYAGGAFQGVLLAGAVLGTLAGQTESASTSFDLPFSVPPAGAWHFVLMLREWTAVGYITRDFTNFVTPVIYTPGTETVPPKTETPSPAEAVGAIPAVPAKTSPAVLPPDLAINPAGPVAATPAKAKPLKDPPIAPLAPTVPPQPQPTASVPDEVAKSAANATTTPAKTLASKNRPSAQLVPTAAKAAPGIARSVSVNTATEDELAAVEGFSPKLAQALIKKRPFASLNDLRRIKGLSAKLLDRIRSRLSL